MPLPALIPLQGDWSDYEDQIYGCFCATLVDNVPFFQGKRIVCQYEPSSKGKHQSFWHCISQGEVEEDRTIDLRRCERIAWIAWMIENADTCEEIVCIRQRRGRNRRIVILHATENYAVVLGDGKYWCPLVTSFCPNERKMKRLLAEYEAQKD